MLTLTDNAATLIAGFVRRVGRSSDGGIRICATADGPHSEMDVSFAPAPHPTDEVVEKNGARVFLDEPAAAYLSSKELDATLRNGTVDLTVRPRPWRPTAHLGRDASEP